MVSRKENIWNDGPLKFGGARVLGVFQQATRIACGKRFIYAAHRVAERTGQ